MSVSLIPSLSDLASLTVSSLLSRFNVVTRSLSDPPGRRGFVPEDVGPPVSYPLLWTRLDHASVTGVLNRGRSCTPDSTPSRWEPTSGHLGPSSKGSPSEP